jgi:7-cyano-7-deazaguanine synthase
MKNTVCIYSGGMDSFTLVHLLAEQGELHSCLSFDYGQRHRRELTCAEDVCHELGVKHQIIDLKSLKPLLKGSSLTDDKVPTPEGHYAEKTMKLTVVPNRNMIMLSLGIAYAVSHLLDRVAFGAHSGDHAIYPDCRPEFQEQMDAVAQIANWHPVRVVAPFLSSDKATILSHGLSRGLDYNKTWTCYEGESIACGRCGSCQERLEAFALNKANDPLLYRSRELMEQVT